LRQWGASRHSDSDIFYLLLSQGLASRSDIQAEPPAVRKVEVEALTDATLVAFTARAKKLHTAFLSTGRPRA
jgi:hypothetical protein